MLFKVLLCLGLFLSVESLVQKGYWKNIAKKVCISARNNHYKDIIYVGPSAFILAMKLRHVSGKIGCHGSARSNWGCSDQHSINIFVTDTRNKRIYPSPTLIPVRKGGWYDLPGYGHNSPELVFWDPGFRYLYNRQKLRFWYAEDLFNYTEGDNHGHTCMHVDVYITNV